MRICLGDAAQGAEHGVLARRAGKAGEEVVLDEPQVVKAHLVGQFALLQRLFVEFVPIDLGALKRPLTFVK